MMFRKLYWVTEQLDKRGFSRVTGVYTSIPDLVKNGLSWRERASAFRLTLAKLDSPLEPLGCWTSPDYAGLAEALEEYVQTDEFTSEHCNALVEHLKVRQHAVA